MSKTTNTHKTRLSAGGLDLARLALGLLLAGDTSTDLAGGSLGRGLGLLSLLLALGRGLLLLGVLDGGLTGGGAGFGALRTALLDHVKRGTDDGSLVFDGAACSFLGDFL